MRAALAEVWVGSTAWSWVIGQTPHRRGTGADQGPWRGCRPVGRRVPERRLPGDCPAVRAGPGSRRRRRSSRRRGWRPAGRSGVREPVPGGRRVRRTGAGVGGPRGAHARAGELPRGGRAGDRRRDRPRGPGRPGAAAGGRNRAHHRRRGRRGQRRGADRGGQGARPLGVASPGNHEYLRGLGASEVFDYHAADWVQQVRAAVPGGVDLLLDGAGGQTRDRPSVRFATAAGRSRWSPQSVPSGSSAASPASRSPPTAAGRGSRRSSRLVDSGRLRPQVSAVLPLDQAREALALVAGRHARGKIVLEIGQ